MCSKLTIKTLERRHDIILFSLLLNLKYFTLFSSVFIVVLEQVNDCTDGLEVC